MKKIGVLSAGLMGIMMAAVLTLASCDNGTNNGGGGGSSNRSSCAEDYGCNSSSDYCGRSTCDARYVGEKCDC